MSKNFLSPWSLYFYVFIEGPWFPEVASSLQVIPFKIADCISYWFVVIFGLIIGLSSFTIVYFHIKLNFG